MSTRTNRRKSAQKSTQEATQKGAQATTQEGAQEVAQKGAQATMQEGAQATMQEGAQEATQKATPTPPAPPDVAAAMATANIPQGPESGTFVREEGRFSGKAVISAKDLELKTLGGTVYQHVTFDAHPGEVVAIRGRNGSGKTALLLTLAARMKSTGGTLQVAGFDLPRQHAKAARHVGMALFDTVNDLQSSLTVAYAVGAEFELYGRKPKREAVRSFLEECGILSLASTRIKDLTAQQRVHVGIALAFIPNPDLIVVDDIEDQLTKAQSETLMEILIDVARSRNIAIVVGVLERDIAAMADTCVYLSKEDE